VVSSEAATHHVVPEEAAGAAKLPGGGKRERRWSPRRRLQLQFIVEVGSSFGFRHNRYMGERAGDCVYSGSEHKNMYTGGRFSMRSGLETIFVPDACCFSTGSTTRVVGCKLLAMERLLHTLILPLQRPRDLVSPPAHDLCSASQSALYWPSTCTSDWCQGRLIGAFPALSFSIEELTSSGLLGQGSGEYLPGQIPRQNEVEQEGINLLSSPVAAGNPAGSTVFEVLLGHSEADDE
jgi:hypothetical protein